MALTWAEPSGDGFVGWIVDEDPSLESAKGRDDDKLEVCCGRPFKLEAVWLKSGLKTRWREPKMGGTTSGIEIDSSTDGFRLMGSG